jgi:hypothetical protein
MSTAFQKIESVAVTAGKDIGHVVEDVITVGDSVVKVLTDAKTLAPAFKSELATLIADAEPIATVLSPIIVAGGSNVALDLAAVAPVLADLKKLVADFVAFLPTLKTAVADLEADVH